MYSGSGDGGAAAQQKRTQAQIDSGMATIDKNFSGFNEDFYQKAARDYESYATPQMMDQFRNTKNNLTYSLARNGLLNSGADVSRMASLNKTLGVNESNIANTAEDQANTLRGNVATQRNQLVSQVQAGAAPGQIANSAEAATAGLRAPTALPPVGNMFSEWANSYLTNMQANTYNPNTANLWQMLSMGQYGQPSSASVVGQN
jgi:hypothetical protein